MDSPSQTVPRRRLAAIHGAALFFIITFAGVWLFAGHRLTGAIYRGEIFRSQLEVKVFSKTQLENIRERTLEEYVRQGDAWALGLALWMAAAWFLAVLSLDPDAVQRRLPPPFQRRPSLLAYAPPAFFAALSAYCLRNNPDFLEGLCNEDMLVENLQFLFYLTAGLRFALSARRGPFALVLAGLLFFVAAEEISWGQRIAGVGAPSWWPNLQGETNFHNLRSVRSRHFLFAVASLGFLPFLARTVSARARVFLDRIRFPEVPLPAALSFFTGLVFYAAIRFEGFSKIKQVLELFVSYGLLVMSFSTGPISKQTKF